MKRLVLGLIAAATLLVATTGTAMARGYYYPPYYRPYYRPYVYGAYRPYYYPPPPVVVAPPAYGPMPYPAYPAPGVGVGVYTPGFSFSVGGR